MPAQLTSCGAFECGPVSSARLTSASGVYLEVSSYGARITDWRVPVGDQLRPVVLAYARLEDYFNDKNYFGAVVGRVINRIGGAEFELEGKHYRLATNEGDNHLHGGPRGAARANWKMEADGAKNRVRLTLFSADGEEGYPGAVDYEVIYSLKANRLRMEMGATVSQPTPINMGQHNYFNLMGHGDVLGHRLQINAAQYTKLDADLIATGEILPVAGTDFDFRRPRTMTDVAGQARTFDLNYVLDNNRNGEAPVARVLAPDGSVELKLWTDQRGLQLYNAAYFEGVPPDPAGRVPEPYGGFCLEDQGLPNAVNIPPFPTIIVKPGQPYRHICEIEIGAVNG
jgi:aldose 1-epimerase